MSEKIKVMINGVPGNVAVNTALFAIDDPRFEVVPFSMTGPEIEDSECEVKGVKIALVKPGERDEIIGKIKADHGPFITIDYTHPTAVNSNGEFYADNRLPFVMGTTGGDRELLVAKVESSDIPAVIAPNMAKQIVGLQAMMEYAAENFKGLFNDYTLDIKESHQNGKADTSGTAKAIAASFNELGIDFNVSDIAKERDPYVQKEIWGVPDEFIGGHAWHTYTLNSKDKTVKFAITHNVNGRDVYSRGTLDAVEYLQTKIDDGAKGKVFSMIDVLKGK